MAAALRLLTLLLLASGTCAHAAEDLAGRAAAAEARREIFVEGSAGWRFLPAELRFASALASPDLGAKVAPAIDAIADLSAQLRAMGIKLLVVPVPPKVLLQAERLGLSASEQEAMKSGWERIMSGLGAREVTVVDLLPRFARSTENPFCLRDTHWSGRGVVLAASEIVPMLEIAGLELAESPPAEPRWTAQTIQGDLGGEPEEVQLPFRDIKSDPAAAKLHPLLLLGDSHLLVFHAGGALHAAGAGLPEQLAAATGGMPDVIGVMGSGATSSRVALARRVRSEATYLAAKKVVVWCFAAREFTEAESWKKIPLQRAAP
jgi:alginate O-acetyltransferase complex protein AlgJ